MKPDKAESDFAQALHNLIASTVEPLLAAQQQKWESLLADERRRSDAARKDDAAARKDDAAARKDDAAARKHDAANDLSGGLVTLKQAANFLAVSEATIYRLAKDGKLAAKKIGRSTRITQESLSDYSGGAKPMIPIRRDSPPAPSEYDGKRLIRVREVERRTSITRSEIYKRIRQGAFPKPIPIGRRAVAWNEDEIDEYIQNKMNARRPPT